MWSQASIASACSVALDERPERTFAATLLAYEIGMEGAEEQR
jgi:hypothetical protein